MTHVHNGTFVTHSPYGLYAATDVEEEVKREKIQVPKCIRSIDKTRQDVEEEVEIGHDESAEEDEEHDEKNEDGDGEWRPSDD